MSSGGLLSYCEQVRSQLKEGRSQLERLRSAGARQCARLLGSASASATDNPIIGLCGIADRLPLDAVGMFHNYSQGLYPLDFGGRLRWHCPNPRFVLYLEELRPSPKMRRDISKRNFTHTFDREPEAVLDACADPAQGTWLSPRLKQLYLQLFEIGVMHSVETWRDGALVGGSFGLAVGQVFMGETLFHRQPDAGKSAVLHLATHLRERGFVCLDAQAPSEHMQRFGAREIPLHQYRKTLALGLVRSANFRAETGPESRPKTQPTQ